MFNGNDYVSVSRLSPSLSLSHCCVVFTVLFCSVALTDFNRVLVLPARGSCVLYQLKFAFEKPLRRNVYVYMYYIWRCQQRSQQRRRQRRQRRRRRRQRRQLRSTAAAIANTSTNTNTITQALCRSSADVDLGRARFVMEQTNIYLESFDSFRSQLRLISISVNHPTPSREGNSICVLFFRKSYGTFTCCVMFIILMIHCDNCLRLDLARLGSGVAGDFNLEPSGAA